jgi:hypothetical protein
MLRRVRVLAGMPVGRTVAATRPPALLAGAQVYPLRAYLHAACERLFRKGEGLQVELQLDVLCKGWKVNRSEPGRSSRARKLQKNVRMAGSGRFAVAGEAVTARFAANDFQRTLTEALQKFVKGFVGLEAKLVGLTLHRCRGSILA